MQQGISVEQPPLKPLHPDESLILLKLIQFRGMATEELLRSLAPGQLGALKARPDGTIIDGHHRIKVLRERGIDVDGLPREMVRKSS
jgi:ParB-like chromosome segregation protein Spo0J